MKIATILPTAYLNLIEGNKYHMALAHLVGKDAVYTSFYQGESIRGAYVIMDNGVIEGAQQSIEDICTKAEWIGAKEIILPDVYLDSDATLEKSYEALMFVRKNYPHLHTMVVPQGKTLEQWLQCADLMLDWDIDAIGIPKVLTSIGGRDARLQVLATLNETHEEQLRSVSIHLLGCWENPIECTMIEKAVQQEIIPEVRGVDSAIAYVYAREGMLITDGPRPTGAIHFDAKDADVEKLKANIEIWENAVDLSSKKVTRIYR